MGKTKTGAAASLYRTGRRVQTSEGTQIAPPSRLPAYRERDLEGACSDFLALDGWRTLKTDPVSDRSRGKGFGELGMADRLYIRYFDGVGELGRGTAEADAACRAQVLWIEWKRARPGRKKAEAAAAHQKLWHAAERARGALVLLAGVDFPADFDSFVEWYRKSGLRRRTGL